MSFHAENTTSAAGKVILLGEHAVVHGQPALAVPISDLRATVRFEAADSPVIVAKDLQRQTSLDLQAILSDPLAQMAVQTAQLLKVEIPHARFEISSTIPLASGLGSGAAVSAALGRAVALAAGETLDNDALNSLVYAIEKLHHGTPSGIDNTVVVYEKPVFFIREQPPQLLSVEKPITLLIGDTGIAAPTRDSVEAVGRLVMSNAAQFGPVIEAIGAIVRAGREAVSSGDLVCLGQLMNANHALLQVLTVSAPALDRLVDAARAAGALGAKLSGGGRGGNMIALVDDMHESAVRQALLDAGALSVFRSVVSPTLST